MLSLEEVATNSARLNELLAQRQEKQKSLDDCYEVWEHLSEELEKDM
jgi:hypothetical protein